MKSTSWIGSPRIFIIDNSLADCYSMRDCLRQAGCNVDFATDGWEGLRKVMAHPPQCLILNAILSGISGYAICRQIRTVDQRYTLPIIVMGTKNTLLNQKYSIKMGANSYLARPFSEDELRQAVKKMLPEFSLTPDTQLLPTTPKSTIPVTPKFEDTAALIPYLQNEDDIMLKRNPFAGSIIVTDRNLNRLYTAINGHRNIRELSEMMQLDLPATLKFLKTLWQQQYIAFYDSKRRPLKDISIFDNIS